jgi:arylsulfatase A-like enzyme
MTTRREVLRWAGAGLAATVSAGVFDRFRLLGAAAPAQDEAAAYKFTSASPSTSAFPSTSLSAARKPNIIVFLADDLGWQDTSEPFYTRRTPFNERYRTPAMERLAHRGMKFTQAYACSVCSPTRVSLMTGMNAARHRVTNWTFRRNKPSDAPHPFLRIPDWNMNGMSPIPGIERTVHATPLPALFKAAGYRTIHCGKAHLGALDTPGANPLNLGFDVNIAGHAAGGPGSYSGLHNFSAAWRNGDRVWDVPGLKAYHGKDISLTEALTREALAAVESAVSEGRPFFLYMSHYAVHAPIEEDPRFIKRYTASGLDPIEARYASMVEALDKSLGDILDFLDARGIADETTILFMSDNGGLSAQGRGGEPHTHNKPLRSGKGSAYEGGIREPMVVSWPGVTRPGILCETPVIIEDFFPTLLEMAGIQNSDIVQTVDGHSFVPLLRGQGQVFGQGEGGAASRLPADRPLIWHYPNNWGPSGPGIGASSTIRLGDWKLIYYHADRRFELFNLARDIGEQNDLAARESVIVERLARLLTEYLRSVDAQMPVDTRTDKPIPLPLDALQNRNPELLAQNTELYEISDSHLIS